VHDRVFQNAFFVSSDYILTKKYIFNYSILYYTFQNRYFKIVLFEIKNLNEPYILSSFEISNGEN
jgi:hypothetical protein